MLSKLTFFIVGAFFLTLIASQIIENEYLPYVVLFLIFANFMMMIINLTQSVRRSAEKIWIVNMSLNLGLIMFVAICVYLARIEAIEPMFYGGF